MIYLFQSNVQLRTKDVQSLSKGIESMQMDRLYEHVPNTDADQSPPYRTEMSLVLSYSGNKSKYSTTQTPDKRLEGDVETPPPNLPHAMKLLPNKLTYNGSNEIFKQMPTDQSIIHTGNSVNEEISSNSQVEYINVRNSRNKENGEKHEFVNSDCATSHGSKNKETTKRNSNDSQESVRNISFQL